jgi:hypothetical protein
MKEERTLAQLILREKQSQEEWYSRPKIGFKIIDQDSGQGINICSYCNGFEDFSRMVRISFPETSGC